MAKSGRTWRRCCAAWSCYSARRRASRTARTTIPKIVHPALPPRNLQVCATGQSPIGLRLSWPLEATFVSGMDLLGLLLMLGQDAAPPATAGVTQKEIAVAAAEAVESAKYYANCAGWWDFLATHEREAGRPASAEQFKNLGNGAQTAALWLHGQAYSLTATKPARYKAWLPLVAPLREGAAIRAAAMAEHGKIDLVLSELQRCEALLESQQRAIDSIRNDNVQRELDASTSGD